MPATGVSQSGSALPRERKDAFNALNWVFDNIYIIVGDRDKVPVGGRSSGSNLVAGISPWDKETVSGVGHMNNEDVS